MNPASGFEVMSPGQIDEEKHFLTTYEIMTTEEFTEFTNNRKSFTQNILSGKATREDLLVQITLESMILNRCEQKIELIMQATYIGNFNTEIGTILSNRILDMYTVLFKKFKYDVNLVSKYIQFCLENKKLTKNYKTVLDDIMDSFHSDPEIYITGAHHAFDDCNDIESARRYISIGIKFHEDLKKLYVEDFWIEVKNLNQTGDISLQVALKKYTYIIQHFKDDIELHFDLVDTVLDEHIKMTELQCTVVRDMVNKYRKNELMWQKLAKIHLNGFVYNYDTETLQKIQSIKQHVSIRNCFKTYDKALTENLSPKNQQHLWDLFLDDIIDIQSSIDKNDEADRHDDIEAEEEALMKALNILNDNLDLWTKLFDYYINHDLLRNAMAVLFEAAKIIKDKTLPLWEIMELHVLSTDRKTIEEFYKECSLVLNAKLINLRFRPEYLEWNVLTSDIVSGRQVFKSLKPLEPKSLDLYKRMLRFETLSIISEEKRHINYMRGLYSEACNLFGHMDIELWHNCMIFEYMYGVPSLVDVIYEAGLNLLEKPSLRAELTKMKHKLDEQFKVNDVINIEDDE